MKHICIHHIGARVGNKPLPPLESFKEDFVNVFYDADENCIAQIKAKNRNLQSEFLVLPYCLGNKHKKKVVFNITYDPCVSSLRKFNKEYNSWYFYFRREKYDYVLSEVIKTMEKRMMELVTLDGLLKRDSSIIPPDILLLDTQGTEYEVLYGAKKALKSNIIAVITEVEFHPIYKGQKLFGDIFSLLRENEFHFVKFLKIEEYVPYRAAIGLRGDGFQGCGDALFIRKILDIERIKDLNIQQEMLDKLAFISIIFHQFEYALECIKRSRVCRESFGFKENDGKDYSYIKMLREIEKEVQQFKKDFPPTFAEKYSFKESKARFKVDSDFGKEELQSVKPNQCNIKEYDDSNIEKILRKYGLQQQADVIKDHRVRYYTSTNFPDKGKTGVK